MIRSGALLGFTLLLSACHDHAAGPPSVEYNVECDTPGYTGPTASDENYTRFIEKEAASGVMTDRCRAPELTAPAGGATLDPDAPPTISFNVMPATCALPAKARPAQQARCAPRRTLRGVLRELFSLEGTAQAHCPAFTGENHLLRLTAGGQTIYEALLSVTSFTPSAERWRDALSGRRGQTVEIRITRGIFMRGSLMEAYVSGTPSTFQVAP